MNKSLCLNMRFTWKSWSGPFCQIQKIQSISSLENIIPNYIEILTTKKYHLHCYRVNFHPISTKSSWSFCLYSMYMAFYRWKIKLPFISNEKLKDSSWLPLYFWISICMKTRLIWNLLWRILWLVFVLWKMYWFLFFYIS